MMIVIRLLQYAGEEEGYGEWIYKECIEFRVCLALSIPGCGAYLGTEPAGLNVWGLVTCPMPIGVDGKMVHRPERLSVFVSIRRSILFISRAMN